METEPHYDQNVFWLNNPGQKTWNKVEKSRKIRQDMKNLISTFTCFLTAMAKSYVVRRLVRQLVYQLCYTRYQVWFYL